MAYLLVASISLIPNMMQTLLEKEGIKVEKDKVKDFKKIFWDPNELTD
jgi:hypothetical protein